MNGLGVVFSASPFYGGANRRAPVATSEHGLGEVELCRTSASASELQNLAEGGKPAAGFRIAMHHLSQA
jgi:hypothetical protein